MPCWLADDSKAITQLKTSQPSLKKQQFFKYQQTTLQRCWTSIQAG